MADFSIKKFHGDTWDIPVEVTDDDTGLPVDFTGATIVFTLETESESVDDFYFSDPAGATPNTAGISIVRNDAAGAFTITLTSTLMDELDDKTQYVFDVTVDDAAGSVLTLFVANIDIEEKA